LPLISTDKSNDSERHWPVVNPQSVIVNPANARSEMTVENADNLSLQDMHQFSVLK